MNLRLMKISEHRNQITWQDYFRCSLESIGRAAATGDERNPFLRLFAFTDVNKRGWRYKGRGMKTGKRGEFEATRAARTRGGAEMGGEGHRARKLSSSSLLEETRAFAVQKIWKNRSAQGRNADYAIKFTRRIKDIIPVSRMRQLLVLLSGPLMDVTIAALSLLFFMRQFDRLVSRQGDLVGNERWSD